MQLGISTYSFPWAIGVAGYEPSNPLTARGLLEVAMQSHIHFVQFGDNYPLHHLSPQELTDLKNYADEWNIQIQVGTRGLTMANINTYLSIASFVNSDFLRIVIDDTDYHPLESEVILIIKTLLPQLKFHGVKLAIENHDRFASKTLKKIIEETDPECVGICLDTANSFGAGEGISEVVAYLAPYTFNLHLKDFIIDRVQHKMGFHIKGCAAGEGLLDIPWLVNEVCKYERCNTATLEVWSDPEPTIEATVQKEKEWAEKSIYYLKTIIS